MNFNTVADINSKWFHYFDRLIYVADQVPVKGGSCAATFIV